MNHSLLPHTSPEAQGISSAAVLDFVTTAEKTIHHLHSFVLLRHGRVVAQGWWHPYNPETPHMLFSLSKSFTSSAVGLAVTEGRLSLDDQLISFFPEELPPKISPNLAAMKIRHLLSMSTGHQDDTTDQIMGAPDPIKAFLNLPVEHEPGTFFVYNSGASFMLAAIVQKLTGQTLVEYLNPRLFEPLGIQGAAWDSHPNGVAFGGWGLNIKTEDIARFGQLYLQKGRWQGRPILPSAWVEEATAKHISNASDNVLDWAQGYGFQFWRCQPQGVYRMDGAFGQFCIVMPEQDAVLAVTAGVSDMQAVLNLVWEKLLPAMQPEALPEDSFTAQTLAQTLQKLALNPTAGNSGSPLAADLSAKTLTFEPNSGRLQLRIFDGEPHPASLDALTFDFDANTFTYSFSGEQGSSHTLNFGLGVWLENTAVLNPPTPSKVAASGIWTAEDTFTLDLCLYETPFTNTLAFTFAQDQVTLNFKTNVSFGQTEFPPITGKLSAS